MHARLHRTALLLTLLLILVLVAACSPIAPPPTRLSGGATVAVSTMAKQELVFTPPLAGVGAFDKVRGQATDLTTYLAGATGIPMRAFVPNDYGETMRGIRAGDYDVIYLPAPFYVKAVQEYGVTGIMAVSANGATVQKGLILTLADSDIASLADLAGQSVAAGELESASAWVLPAAALADAGVNPFTDIDLQITGADVDSLIVLLDGKASAVFVDASALTNAKVLEKAADVADQVKILAQFDNIPIGGIVLRQGVTDEQSAAIVAALAAADADLLAGLGWDSLMPADQVNFGPVTAAARTIGMIE